MALVSGTLTCGRHATQTASIQQWFAALIAGYPEIQEKAHAELDRVCGRDRFPTEDDEKSLPYIRAIAKVSFGTVEAHHRVAHHMADTSRKSPVYITRSGWVLLTTALKTSRTADTGSRRIVSLLRTR